jgi:PAS domain S-box-containing protein
LGSHDIIDTIFRTDAASRTARSFPAEGFEREEHVTDTGLTNGVLILDNLPSSIVQLDKDMRIVWANKAARDLIGMGHEGVSGRPCYAALNKSVTLCAGCPAAGARDEKRPQKGEVTTPDGRVWFVGVIPLFDEGGGVTGFVETRHDVTEQKLVDETLKETRNLFRLLAENAKDLIYHYRLSPARGFGYVSPASIPITGHSPEDFYLNPDLFVDLAAPEDAEKVRGIFKSPDRDEGKNSFRIQSGEGSLVWVEQNSTLIRDTGGRVVGVEGIVRDVTEKMRLSEQQKLATQILEVLNGGEDRGEKILLILLSVKEYTGFDAVGIRLKENGDYPYYETRGFDSEFVRKESSLCAVDEHGRALFQADGKTPVLECLCGHVIGGNGDHLPGNGTKSGSLWINNSIDLERVSQMDVKNLRSRCFRDGYKSLALIPLRSGDTTIGLFQLNDKRQDMVTGELVYFLEGIGASIGVAFDRMRMEEERKTIIAELEESLRTTKSLAGLIPICAGCKKVRDDKEYWKQIEAYMKDNPDPHFTHGYCPECRAKLKEGRS